MTAHHWRTVRLKLALAGINDPMKLPSMHILLDMIEQMVLEAMVSDKPEHDKAQRQQFQDSLYRPVLEPGEIMGSGHKPKPAGFDDDELDAAFDAAFG